MIEGNLRLVVAIAKKYYHPQVSLADIIEEGNIGLMRALEKYNPNKGTKFSTYATFWITQYIAQYVSSQMRTIRIPEHIVYKLKQWQRESEKLKQSLGRQPSSEEIAKKLKISLKDIGVMLENLELSQAVSSLDVKIDDNEAVSVGDMLPDGEHEDPAVSMRNSKIAEQLEKVLRKLTAKERIVMRHRFELTGHPKKTLSQLGKSLGLSRERIRQIEKKAFNKIKDEITQLRSVGNDDL